MFVRVCILRSSIRTREERWEYYAVRGGLDEALDVGAHMFAGEGCMHSYLCTGDVKLRKRFHKFLDVYLCRACPDMIVVVLVMVKF